MGLIAMVCPNCGAQLELSDEKDKYFCQFCGTQLVPDTQKVEVSGNVTVAGMATAGSLLERAQIFMGDGSFDEAAKYFDRVLDAQPKCAAAYMGKALCAIKCRDLKKLPQMSVDITGNSDFNKALKFASADEKESFSRAAGAAAAKFHREKEIADARQDIAGGENELSSINQRTAFLASGRKKLNLQRLIFKILFIAAAVLVGIALLLLIFSNDKDTAEGSLILNIILTGVFVWQFLKRRNEISGSDAEAASLCQRAAAINERMDKDREIIGTGK